ncbi:type II toxin-antitoxin system RelE/ParE family toxin [Rhodopirellula islandica]|uniref:type II toxin-antitoxin system RelE/ParE family toxin n=1 Tax=Rhodopirellula islandica TaxID=595434 RepID=UPI00064A4868|nr:type II toxin-antitoxin system RelE/ParE family toxin [Rhodopirellula islandica]
MAKLFISPTTKQDLSDIFDFIARDKPSAAANWIEKIEEKCRLISTVPDFGELRNEYGADIRSSVVGRYVIFYRLIQDGIEVARVIPGDRDIRSL